MVQRGLPILVLFYDQGGAHLFTATKDRNGSDAASTLSARLFKAEA
jgi:hypothetical protein